MLHRKLYILRHEWSSHISPGHLSASRHYQTLISPNRFYKNVWRSVGRICWYQTTNLQESSLVLEESLSCWPDRRASSQICCLDASERMCVLSCQRYFVGEIYEPYTTKEGLGVLCQKHRGMLCKKHVGFSVKIWFYIYLGFALRVWFWVFCARSWVCCDIEIYGTLAWT